MRLHNLLTMPGGIPEQGREVTFALRYRGADGAPHTRQVVGVLLPLSEVEMQKAAADAKNQLLPEGEEYVVRLLQASLRDPGDLGKLLIEDETDLRDLRAGLVAPQYDWFLKEYRLLLEQEYPDLISEKQVGELRTEAQDFSPSDRPARG